MKFDKDMCTLPIPDILIIADLVTKHISAAFVLQKLIHYTCSYTIMCITNCEWCSSIKLCILFFLFAGLVSEILSYVLKIASESEGRQPSLGDSGKYHFMYPLCIIVFIINSSYYPSTFILFHWFFSVLYNIYIHTTDISVQENVFRECFCLLRLLATDRKSVSTDKLYIILYYKIEWISPFLCDTLASWG